MLKQLNHKTTKPQNNMILSIDIYPFPARQSTENKRALQSKRIAALYFIDSSNRVFIHVCRHS